MFSRAASHTPVAGYVLPSVYLNVVTLKSGSEVIQGH